MIHNHLLLLIFFSIVNSSLGDEIVFPEPSSIVPPDPSLNLPVAPPVSEMRTALPYDVGWFRVAPAYVIKSTSANPEPILGFSMWTATRCGHPFLVSRTASVSDAIWFGDGYRRILSLTKEPSGERWLVKIDPKTQAIDGLPKLSGALLPCWTKYEYAELWGGCAYVKEIRAIDGSDELEAEVRLLESYFHPIDFERVPDRTVVMRKGDIIEVPAKVQVGKAIAKVRCAGIYRELPKLGFSGGVDLVPIEWTSIEDPR